MNSMLRLGIKRGSKSHRNYIILLIGFILLFSIQSIFIELLHNHPPEIDHNNHNDCPVHILLLNSNSLPATGPVLFLILFLILFNCCLLNIKFKSQIVSLSREIRAPPFSHR